MTIKYIQKYIPIRICKYVIRRYFANRIFELKSAATRMRLKTESRIPNRILTSESKKVCRIIKS